MKKVFYIGVFDPNLCYGAPILGDKVFEKGLKQNGFDVVEFDYRWESQQHGKKMNEYLFNQAIKEDPDMVWMSKAESVNPDIIGKIKKELNIPIIKWAADIREKPQKFELEMNKYTDWFFYTCAGTWLKKHKVNGKVASFFTYCDSGKFYPKEEKKKLKSDILFTGKRFFKKGEKGNPVPLGSGLRHKLLPLLKERYKDKFKVYGDMGQPRVHSQYPKVISNAKIGLGINTFTDKKLYTSARLAHYMSSGTFFLTNYIPGIKNIFDRGKEIDWFNNVNECIEKIDYYLENEEIREEIARRGKKKALKYWDAEPLLSNLLHIIKTGKSKYPWTEIY